MNKLQKLYPHLLSVVGFIIIAVIYFYPVFTGMVNIVSKRCSYVKNRTCSHRGCYSQPGWGGGIEIDVRGTYSNTVDVLIQTVTKL